MKKLLITAVFTAICTFTFAQSKSGFGIKGGLNYNANGDYIESAQAVAENPDRNVGYHIGIFYKLGGGSFYFKPEFMFTKTKSDYPEGEFDLSKLDLPALVGIRLVGPLSFFIGPDFQYILNTKFDGISINDIENDFTVGVHLGFGVNLGKLGVDVRYERGLSENEASFINTKVTSLPTSRIDTRSDQIILSLSVKI